MTDICVEDCSRFGYCIFESSEKGSGLPDGCFSWFRMLASSALRICVPELKLPKF